MLPSRALSAELDVGRYHAPAKLKKALPSCSAIRLEFDMTEEQAKNLATLAAYLRAGCKHGVEFDMWTYDEDNSDGSGRTDCGAVGENRV